MHADGYTAATTLLPETKVLGKVWRYGWGYNKREDRRIAADRAAAEEARQDATLQAYLDEMSGLMLDKKR